MSQDVPQPRVVWARPADEVASGMRVAVSGAVFQIGGAGRSGVTLTVHVPDGYHQELPDEGRAATILLNPDEAQGLGAWLEQAAAAALEAAPPLYD